MYTCVSIYAYHFLALPIDKITWLQTVSLYQSTFSLIHMTNVQFFCYEIMFFTGTSPYKALIICLTRLKTGLYPYLSVASTHCVQVFLPRKPPPRNLAASTNCKVLKFYVKKSSQLNSLNC